MGHKRFTVRARLSLLVIPALVDVSTDVSPAMAQDPLCSGHASARDPFNLYGPRIEFSVLRNGSVVGKHRVDFEIDNSNLRVTSTFNVDVTILGFSAYQYLYQSRSTWTDGCLTWLRAQINDDGEQYTVRADREGTNLKISGPSGDLTTPLGIYPTNHWNAGVLDSTQVFNTLTGDIDTVRIVDRGLSDVIINGKLSRARHYVYQGELSNDVWYDERGRWVKMRFKSSDGSDIEYECLSCARETEGET